MGQTTVPTNWKNCATCTHWCGRAIADAFCSNVKVDSNEKGKCAGGGFNGAEMTPMASCSKWQQRFKK